MFEVLDIFRSEKRKELYSNYKKFGIYKTTLVDWLVFNDEVVSNNII